MCIYYIYIYTYIYVCISIYIYIPLFTDAVLRFIVDIKPEIDIAIFDKQYFMHFFKLAVDLLFGFEVNWTE